MLTLGCLKLHYKKAAKASISVVANMASSRGNSSPDFSLFSGAVLCPFGIGFFLQERVRRRCSGSSLVGTTGRRGSFLDRHCLLLALINRSARGLLILREHRTLAVAVAISHRFFACFHHPRTSGDGHSLLRHCGLGGSGGSLPKCCE